MVLPDQAAKDLEPEWFAEGENIRVADAFIVDLLLNANGQTFDTLSQYTQTIDLDGIPVKTASLDADGPHFRPLVKEKGTRRCLFYLYQAKIRQQPAP